MNPTFWQGYDAYKSGMPISSNPYSETTHPHSKSVWEFGWKSAKKDYSSPTKPTRNVK